MSKKSIVKVTVQQAEGAHADDMSLYTFEGDGCLEGADRQLRRIAITAPATGGYYKTDVGVTFEDNTELNLRFDIKRLGLDDNDTEVFPFVLRYLEVHSGKVVPEMYRDQFTPAQWREEMLLQLGCSAVDLFERLLGLLER